MSKSSLQKNIWSKSSYYQKIASWEDFSHPAFIKTQALSRNCQRILDIGCGDGAKLARLGNPDSQLSGCEVSLQAVALAKRKFPKINFRAFDGDNLPYDDEGFDLVTSFFVLEHTTNPVKLISEAVRVVQKNGLLVLLAPNFGSPNRSSPNFVGSRLAKLVRGFIQDFFLYTQLHWHQVEPKISKISDFQSDLDTTIEPYLGSLIRYLLSIGLIIREADSLWQMELVGAKPWQKFFSFLGKKNLVPFKYWGPHLFVVAQKI